jgi:hypothetical protein
VLYDVFFRVLVPSQDEGSFFLGLMNMYVPLHATIPQRWGNLISPTGKLNQTIIMAMLR